MKKHILVGTTLLLTLGTAVAGTLMYGQDANTALDPAASELYKAKSALLQKYPGRQHCSGAAIACDHRSMEGDRKVVGLHRAESADLNRSAMRATGLCHAQLRGSCRHAPTDLRTVR